MYDVHTYGEICGLDDIDCETRPFKYHNAKADNSATSIALTAYTARAVLDINPAMQPCRVEPSTAWTAPLPCLSIQRF